MGLPSDSARLDRMVRTRSAALARAACPAKVSPLIPIVRRVSALRTGIVVTVGVLDVAGVLWGANGARHVVRALHDAPPAEPREPKTRLEQLRVLYAGRFRGWIVVFSAAVVGAAVSDYDRDPRHGLRRMIALFLFVTAGLIVMGGVSVGRAGKHAHAAAKRKVRGYDDNDLFLSCIVGGIALAFGVAFAATVIS
jgi:hypothetical protein